MFPQVPMKVKKTLRIKTSKTSTDEVFNLHLETAHQGSKLLLVGILKNRVLICSSNLVFKKIML